MPARIARADRPWLIMLLSALVATVSSAAPSPAPKGVVVESVARGSALAKAGLQAGDVVLAWERRPHSPANPKAEGGTVDSYFDWWWLETEQAPRGPVSLTINRGDEIRLLEARSGSWSSTVRPWMDQEALALYVRGKEHIDGQEVASGIRHWRELERQATDRHLRCWLLLQIAAGWSEIPRWDKAQEAFRSALEAAGNPTATAVVWRAKGQAHWNANEPEAASEALAAELAIWEARENESLALAVVLRNLSTEVRRHGDDTRADEYLERSLGLVQRLAPTSHLVAKHLQSAGLASAAAGDLKLAHWRVEQSARIFQGLMPDGLDVAKSLRILGMIARADDDPTRARGYGTRALEIQQRLAPNSFDTATTLRLLGILAKMRGHLDLAYEYEHRAFQIYQRRSPNSPDLANSLMGLSAIASMRGDLHRGRELLGKAIEILEKSGAGDIFQAAGLGNLGLAALQNGDLDLSLELIQRELEAWQKLDGASHYVAGGHQHLAMILTARGDIDLAQTHYQKARDLLAASSPKSISMAEATSHRFPSVRQPSAVWSRPSVPASTRPWPIREECPSFTESQAISTRFCSVRSPTTLPRPSSC